MFEVIFMDFWRFLSTERSSINVETEARPYCSGGGSSIGVAWQNILGDGVSKKFCLG